MTIYIVMRHSHEATAVPVSAWRTMTEATLDMIERERTNAYMTITYGWAYTVVPVALSGKG